MILLKALEMSPTSRRPVWIMRQAGRYLASFRKLREKYSFDEFAGQADLAVEVSLLPLQQYELDAAIVFSDILIPLRAMGAQVHFGEAGPKLETPKQVSDLKNFGMNFDPSADTPVILESLQKLRKLVKPEVAVLGFAGAPFTLLVYLLEGELTKDFSRVKTWMAKEPKFVHELLARLSRSTADYLDAQARAGANAVQLFDTWASILSPKDYEEFALPYARQTMSGVTVPCIYYVNGGAGILDSLPATGAQALSVDWRIELSEARKRISPVVALQGNLDPYMLFRSKDKIREAVFAMCEAYGTGPGHIANLGHGIVPGVPEDAVSVFVSAVHEWSASALKT